LQLIGADYDPNLVDLAGDVADRFELTQPLAESAALP
jgi:hypothetical protein